MSKLASLFFCFLLTAISGFSQTPNLRIHNGLINGTQTADGSVNIYKAIPFAAPPVGEWRWKAPQPVADWDGVLACDKFPASAMQPPPVPFFVWSQEFMAPPAPLSEDCLYLNVWAPTKTGAEKLPVIVWVHGGGFTSGAGSCPIYDGEGMAKKGVVYVTINYRLGVFGFLAHPELSLESGNNSSGNYAFLDQIAALQWVQQNIAAFGGDPKRVTIAGQSAGAFSVNALMASPLAKGLFQRVIAESGGMFSSDRLKSLAEASLEGLAFMKKLNAANIAELRKLPAEAVLNAGPINSAVLDGHVLPKDVAAIFNEGKQNDVPLLTGWNRDEGFIFSEPLRADAFREQAVARYGELSGQFLEAFPAGDDAQAKQSQKNLNRDQLFAWQNYKWATLQSTKGSQKAWLYRFDRVPPGRPDLAEHGAFHSAEIGYALNTLATWDRSWEALDRQLAEQMSSYWVNFASNGDPNGKGLPMWTNFQADRQNTMVFGEKTAMQNGLLQQEFAFLDAWKEASTLGFSYFKKDVFVLNGDTIHYRILYPENYDYTKKYPLVLFLHGGGERGNDNEKQLVHGASMFLKNENRKAFPCIVLVPQCPGDSYWSSATLDRTTYPIKATYNYKNDLSKGLRLAMELTQKTIAENGVDKGRVYITGLSMGGMGTFEAVYHFPELFAAAVPICGGGDVQAYNEKTSKIPFRIFHGDADGVVPVQYSRDIFDRLKSLGNEVSYIEYPSVNHNSWDYAFAEKDFLAWMFGKRK